MAYAIYEHNERASNQAITSNYEIYYEHSVMTLVQATTKTILMFSCTRLFKWKKHSVHISKGGRIEDIGGKIEGIVRQNRGHLRPKQGGKVKLKLDGVGPVDNRPSTDKLHQFVRKKINKKIIVTCDTWHVTRDTWHVTCDMWHVTRDTWHVTHDTWHVWGGEHSLKISAP